MSADAKQSILARIRQALADAPEVAPAPHDFIRQDTRERDDILAELVDRLRDYKAHVEQVAESEAPAAIARACAQYGMRRVVAPADFPPEWAPDGVEVLRDEPPLSNQQLDESDGALTGCSFAIAQTGTIVLDGGAMQGRRALTLVPDRHLCIVLAEQVVGIVPEGVALLARRPTRPITFISGPSATSDIELSRVEGVHGPRTLHVVLVGG